MARGRFMFDPETQTVLPAHEVLAKRAAAAPKSASSLPRPFVIGSMPEVRSMIDGQIYDSKSTYYRHVERNGCEIVGFDPKWQEQIKAPTYDARAHEAEVVADVKKSIEQLNSGTAEPVSHAGR
jgi:hypothetical protein